MDPRAGLVIVNADNLTLQITVANPVGPVGVAWGATPVAATAVPSSPGTETLSIPIGAIGESATQVGILKLTSGAHSRRLQVGIGRIPGLSVGGVKVPALPIALVYAPPPGSQGKNNAQYENAVTLDHKIDTSVAHGSTTKQATAYTTTDFITKLAGLAKDVDSIAGLVKSAISGAVGGATGDGASGSGSSGAGSPVQTVIGAVSDILTGLTTNTQHNDSSRLTVTSDQSMETKVSYDVTYTAGPPGPAQGDLFVFLRNVRLCWLISGGQLHFTVLGTTGCGSGPRWTCCRIRRR